MNYLSFTSFNPRKMKTFVTNNLSVQKSNTQKKDHYLKIL